jgi:hypothetical protein
MHLEVEEYFLLFRTCDESSVVSILETVYVQQCKNYRRNSYAEISEYE